jgi:hypothetical protein
LQAELDVLLWDRDSTRFVSIREPGALPLRTGDRFQVEARLNRPAHVYLLWLDTDGRVLPLFPSGASTPLDYLLLPVPDPVHGERPWVLEGEPGLETIVLLADDDPRDDVVQSLTTGPGSGLSRVPLVVLGAADRADWFSSRQEEFAVRTRGPALASQPAPGPRMQVRSFLRRLGPLVRLVQAVSFVNAGPQSSNC